MTYIIGSDESGTGSISGPFLVCAVRAPENWSLDGLNDSKKLTAKKRGEMAQKLMHLSQAGEIDYILIEVSNTKIDSDGLGLTLKEAHKDAINVLASDETVAIIDGNMNITTDCPTTSIVKADETIPTVMAASILAKNCRDFRMKELHKIHPEYLWNKNSGYGTKAHKDAIEKHGLSQFHRKSFKLNS